jgi:hypothetical protein
MFQFLCKEKPLIYHSCTWGMYGGPGAMDQCNFYGKRVLSYIPPGRVKGLLVAKSETCTAIVGIYHQGDTGQCKLDNPNQVPCLPP